MRKQVRPYGSWPSPIPIDILVTGRVGLQDCRFDLAADGAITWLETRPNDNGRQTLVRWTPDGETRDISPAGMNVRDRVHEYGGAPYLVDGELIIVSDFATGRLHRVHPDRTSEPFTPEGPFRYADYELDRRRNRILAVREDHSGDGEAVNTIVAISLDGAGEPEILAAGCDFVAAPRLSPDGDQLAWLRWNHPNLPWDGTELMLASLDADGRPVDQQIVAGSPTDWISQPRWSPDGVLHFAAEPNGWLNLHRLVDGRVEAITDEPMEFGHPDWLFGYHNYDFLADGSILAIARSRGADRLYVVALGGGLTHLELPFTELSYLSVVGGVAVLLAGGPDTPPVVIRLDPATGDWDALRRSSTTLEPAAVAHPEPIEFPTTGGRTAHGLFYRPTNPAVEGPPSERPPLIVTSHGGPTSQAYSGMTALIQLFTSRGFAVLDVDYGGSTGYGRDYRRRLEGQWGVMDVDDCINGACFLADRGDVDGNRLAIRGGSASGYTTLSALAFRDVFDAGISYFGIGDLMAFTAETHKFESRYLDRLVGPLPESEAVYRERSPNNFVHQIHCPVLILQGLEDRVVPPSEAERIVDALWERRIPHAYLPFEGEDHGFRGADAILTATRAELSFLGQVFGFEPADDIEPIEVVNLEAWRAAEASA